MQYLLHLGNSRSRNFPAYKLYLASHLVPQFLFLAVLKSGSVTGSVTGSDLTSDNCCSKLMLLTDIMRAAVSYLWNCTRHEQTSYLVRSALSYWNAFSVFKEHAWQHAFISGNRVYSCLIPRLLRESLLSTDTLPVSVYPWITQLVIQALITPVI